MQPTALYARADGRFGLEDYILWPQSHSEAYPWAPCVLRRPASEEIRDHEHWFLWDNLTRADWYSPPGSSWQLMGVLRPTFYNIFNSAMQTIITRAVGASSDTPSYVPVAINCLRATLARLRDLPMSYRDLVLQFTQAQRLGLDLLAMEAYHSHLFTRMIQRAQVHPLRSELIGCHTTNPTTVENMYYAGIPVVYIRPARVLTASQLRVRKIAEDFAAVPPDLVTAEWPDDPCKRLHEGASGTRRFQMSRPLGRYFEDLAALPDVAEPLPDMSTFTTSTPDPCARTDPAPQHEDEDIPFPTEESTDFTADSALQEDLVPTTSSMQSDTERDRTGHHPRARRPRPSKQPVQRNSRKGRKLGESDTMHLSLHPINDHAAAANAVGKALSRPVPSKQGQMLACNRNKFAPVISPLMPPYCPEWSAALSAVDRFSTTHTIPKRRTGLMFPDPAYFASVTPLNRSFALPAWLSIRATRCGQMLYPSRGEMRVLPTTVWRYFFFIYRQEPGGPGTLDTSVPSLTDDPQAAIAAASAMFGPQAAASMNRSIREVFWRGRAYTVVDGAIQNISVEATREIIWELHELNWRYELLALDKLAAPHKWVDDDAAGERITELLLVFSPSSSFVLTHAPFPTDNSDIVAITRAARQPAMAALRRVMSAWRKFPADAGTTPGPFVDDIHAQALEAKTMWLYCQTFYDYFHRAPILPCRLP